MPIVIAVGRVGRLEYFKGVRSDTDGIFVEVAAAAGEVSSGGMGGTDRDGIVAEEVGVMNVDGTDGSVVLVLFPDCEIVIVVGGIPAEVDVFVLL
jgi:hypothetical protein